MSRCIDADALIADCQLAQKQADRHGREFANAFYSGGGEVSTEWWCVEDMIENAPTIEPRCEVCEAFNKTRLLIPQPQRKKGKWIEQEDSWDGVYYECSACGEPWTTIDGTPWDNGMKFCPNCGARMEDSE